MNNPPERAATYTATISSLTIRPPVQFLSHHAVRVKWTYGSRKGKLPLMDLVPAYATVVSNSGGGGVAGVPLVRFPAAALSTQVITLDANFSNKSPFAASSSPLTIEVFLIKYTDASHSTVKSKSTKGAVSISADFTERSLFHSPAPFKSNLPQSAQESISVTLTFAKDDEAEAAAQDDGVTGMMIGGGPSTSGSSSSSVFPLEAAELPDGAGDSATAAFFYAEERMRNIIATSTSEAGGEIASLRTIAKEGLFKALNCKLEPTDAAAQLFFPPAGRPSVLHLLHEERGDAEYTEGRWRYASGDRSVMYRNVQYSLKATGSRFFPATEVSFVCAVGDDIVGRAINYSSAAPFVGAALKLETILHITSDGDGGSVIGLYVYALAPDTARRMFGSKLEKQVEKLLCKADTAISEKVPLSTTQLRERSRQSYMRAKVRLSLGQGGGSGVTTVDGIWRKLLEPAVLRQEQFILQYLSQLTLKKQFSVTEIHVATLEGVMVYHRCSQRVVVAVLGALLSLCRVSSSALIGSLSTTLYSSIESVFALYPPGTFAKYEDLLYQMESHNAQARKSKCDEIVKSKNLWESLERHCGHGDGCQAILGALHATATAAGRHQMNRRLQSDHWPTLIKVLALHINNEDVVRGVFQLIKSLDIPIASAIPSRGVEVLQRACAFNKFATHELLPPDTLTVLERRQRGFSSFEKKFSVLNQKLLFECKGCLTSPTVTLITIYLTNCSVILGDFILPLHDITVVQRYKARLFQAGLRFVVGAGDVDFSAIVPSREALLQELQGVESMQAQIL